VARQIEGSAGLLERPEIKEADEFLEMMTQKRGQVVKGLLAAKQQNDRERQLINQRLVDLGIEEQEDAPRRQPQRRLNGHAKANGHAKGRDSATSRVEKLVFDHPGLKTGEIKKLAPKYNVKPTSVQQGLQTLTEGGRIVRRGKKKSFTYHPK
jgi:hypothetical protein